MHDPARRDRTDRADLRIRVVGLGNDLMADDGFGPSAARALAAALPPEVEVVYASAGGLALLDVLEGATHLLVLDAWPRGDEPGTIRQADLSNAGWAAPSGAHTLGLFDALDLGRELHLRMPGRVACVTVEPSDITTVGGTLTPAVAAALPEAVRQARGVLDPWLAEARPASERT